MSDPDGFKRAYTEACLRAFLAGVLSRWAAAGDDESQRAQAVGIDKAECQRLGVLFLSRAADPGGLAAWCRERLATRMFLPSAEASDEDTMVQVLALLVLESYELISQYQSDGDEQGAKDRADALVESWSDLLLGPLPLPA